MSVSDSFAHWILNHRKTVATLLVFLTLIAAAGIYDPVVGKPRIRIDPSLNEMLPADDPARVFYEDLLKRFGSDDVVLIALQSEALFTPEGLRTLVSVTDALAASDGVHHVEGLATAVRMLQADGDLEIAGYFDSPIRTREEALLIREEVLADPLRAGTFVSEEGEATAILVTFDRIPEDEFLARGLDLEILERAQELAPSFSVVMAGTPHIKAEVGRLMTRELTLMVPFVLGLMSALSCGFFRGIRIGLIPIAAVFLGMIWTVGLMGWVGHDLNIVTTLIPPLILALGFAYATHVVSGFVAGTLDGAPSVEGGGARERARRALAHVAFPVTFTALTTAAGFLSLASNGLEVVRGFGLFAAASTAATLLAALTLVPLLLSGVGSGAAGKRQEGGMLDSAFRRLARFDARHSKPILILAGVVCVCAGLATTRIQVNLPVIENFDEQAPIRLAYEKVDRLFGGANQFYVMLRAPAPGDFEQPDWLREVADLQVWLAEQPEIGGTTSVVQYLEVLNEALSGGTSETRALPKNANLVAQLLLFGANEELDVLIDRAHQVITIMVRSTATETREFDGLAKRIDARLAQLPDSIEGHTTGNAILLTRAADRIARGQAMSLLLAGAMIGCLLVFYFRSLRLGLLALVPNLIPVLLYFGLMGATGITLNNSTALMGSIVLGIAVDDTLHLLVEYRRVLRATGDAERALEVALRHVGRAISCTTLAVCAGLLVVGASALQNQAEFGLLGAGTLAVAWLVDVTVTPALCYRWIRQG